MFFETQVLGTYITDSRLLGAFKNICRLQVSVHVVVLGMADERDTSQGLKRLRLVGLRPMGGVSFGAVKLTLSGSSGGLWHVKILTSEPPGDVSFGR